MNDLSVIDLGTNTFHLLIVRSVDGKLKEIRRQREYVKLATEGNKRISESAYRRGLETMIQFARILEDEQVEQCRAVATAALRTAENGADLIEDIYEQTGISIDLIDGFTEAGYIARGVERALNRSTDEYLIMDIGGGSVEFIYVENFTIRELWSFQVGVAFLYSRFHHSEPITTQEINRLTEYLTEELAPMINSMKHHRSMPLVGASGTFDVLGNMCHAPQLTPQVRTIKTDFVDRIYTRMISSTLEERSAMDDVPDNRADMMVIAIILLKSVLNQLPLKPIYVSQYALKEGVLLDMLDEEEPK